MVNFLRSKRRLHQTRGTPPRRPATFAASVLLAAVPMSTTASQQPRSPAQSTACATSVQERFVTGISTTITLPQHSQGFEGLPLLGKTLLMLDMENLHYTMAPAGFAPDYGQLMARLRDLSTDLQAHAFMTANEGRTESVRRELATHNIHLHVHPVQHILVAGGPKKCANSDNALLLHLGHLLA